MLTYFLVCLQIFFYLPLFFFFTDPATTEIYTLSLHDALPIGRRRTTRFCVARSTKPNSSPSACRSPRRRSEEHTSELQSRLHLVCRLLLEKKKNNNRINISRIIHKKKIFT